MAKDISTTFEFLIDKKSFSFDKAFFVYNTDGEKVMYVDIPAFRLIKRLDFFADETKFEQLFSVVQDKILSVTSSEYTLFRNEKPLAKFRADLADNLLKRKIQILYPSGDPLCALAEKSAVGGFLGDLSGASFVFQSGDDILGTFGASESLEGMYHLGLSSGPEQKLAKWVALGAAIILFARLV